MTSGRDHLDPDALRNAVGGSKMLGVRSKPVSLQCIRES
jgi:hypothetical protein